MQFTTYSAKANSLCLVHNDKNIVELKLSFRSRFSFAEEQNDVLQGYAKCFKSKRFLKWNFHNEFL